MFKKKQPKKKQSKKKQVIFDEEIEKKIDEVISEVSEVSEIVKEKKEPKFYPVTVDFPNDQFNNLARKVNEIIEYINAL